MNRRQLIAAALGAVEEERLADADALLDEAMREPSHVSDLLERADAALDSALLKVAEGHLRQALREESVEA